MATMTLAAPAPLPRKASNARTTRAEKNPTQDSLRADAARLLDQEIDFVDNVEFRDERAETTILGPNQQLLEQATSGTHSLALRDLPAHLAALCQAELLTGDEERQLFRAFNYLKFRANVHRSTLDPQRPNARVVHEVKRYLAAAESVRDRLILANMRLVISIVKNFIGPTHSFDDMLSEGVVSLMQAVEKFDYERGFRFSTYAYRAICRNSLRWITQNKKEAARFNSGSADQWLEVPGQGDSSSVAEHRGTRLRMALLAMMNRLDRRERFIIRGRYALGSHRKARTFQCLADKLGVSKERVRQLEQRAVLKLKQMAEEAGLEELR